MGGGHLLASWRQVARARSHMQVWQEQTAEVPASASLALLHSQTSVAPCTPPVSCTHPQSSHTRPALSVPRDQE